MKFVGGQKDNSPNSIKLHFSYSKFIGKRYRFKMNDPKNFLVFLAVNVFEVESGRFWVENFLTRLLLTNADLRKRKLKKESVLP